MHDQIDKFYDEGDKERIVPLVACNALTKSKFYTKQYLSSLEREQNVDPENIALTSLIAVVEHDLKEIEDVCNRFLIP